MIINLNFGWDYKLGNQYLFIENFLKLFPTNTEDIIIDFSGVQFLPPFISVFFSAFIENFNYIKATGISPDSYHSNIQFPHGLKHDLIPNWNERIKVFEKKQFLPLINFNNSKSEKLSNERDFVIAQSCNIVKNVAKIPLNIYTGMSYLISEITDNIVEHSNRERGWISFQYYPSQGFIDFCIADSGIGILGSYQNYQGNKDFSKVKTHLDALNYAILGESTKHLNERGFGVHTSRELLIKGLNGTFLMLSGNAFLHNYNLIEREVFIPGTLIVLRIPCTKFDKNFNYNNFVE